MANFCFFGKFQNGEDTQMFYNKAKTREREKGKVKEKISPFV